MEITRRGFVEGVALGAAGIASCGCVAAPAVAEEAAGTKAPAGEFKAGAYIGSAQGNTGMVYVEVVLSEGPTIESLKIVGNSETDHIIHEVEKVLPDRIVAAQSTDVNVVAGATISSFAVINAVEDALEQAGVDPSSMVAPEKEAGADQTLTCQVLVIGSGPAGLLSAVTLKSRGADVLLVDQLDMIGGTGRFSAGRMFGTMEVSEQERVRDAFLEQTTTGQRSYDEALFPNQDKVERYITSGTEMFDFLKDTCGIELEYYAPKDGWGNENTKVQVGANEHSEVTSTMGYQLTESLFDVYKSMGGESLLGTKVTSLTVGDDGSVTGAMAQAEDGGEITIAADRVVVCTGSAGASVEVQAKYCPDRADGEPRTICRGADGSGIEMMVAAGAQVIPDWVNSTAQYSTHPELACTDAGQANGSSFALSNKIANKTSLLVNAEGSRLGDESNSFVTLLFYKAGVVDCAYAVLDVEAAVSRGLVSEVEQGVVSQPEYFFKAGSIEGLAEAAGMDPSALAATVERYNELCDKGEDVDFGKAPENLLPIVTAPFYMVREVLVNRDIAGGVYTDLDRRVLDATENPIGGLYAAGFCSSRDLYGNGIPGAGSVGMAAVSGYVAGNVIADELGV